jgi:hypothetical protein
MTRRNRNFHLCLFVKNGLLQLDYIDIKPVIIDTACLENSYLNNHVMPKPNESSTQGKFVPTCHNFVGRLVILDKIVIC